MQRPRFKWKRIYVSSLFPLLNSLVHLNSLFPLIIRFWPRIFLVPMLPQVTQIQRPFQRLFVLVQPPAWRHTLLPTN